MPQKNRVRDSRRARNLHAMLLEQNEGRWQVLDEIASTNSYLLNSDSPAGSVVFARSQSQGRGRQGRSWSMRAGDGVAFSGLLEFDRGFPGERLRFLPLLTGLAVLRAAEEACARHPAGVDFEPRSALQVKWPNDVYLGDRKLAGVLVESTAGAGFFRVVLGVGLNFRGAAPEVPDAPVRPAVLFSGDAPGDPVQFFGPLLVGAINKLLPELHTHDAGPPEFLRDLRRRNYLRDRVVRKNGRGLRAVDIADDGRLILEDPQNGRRMHVDDTTEDIQIIA